MELDPLGGAVFRAEVDEAVVFFWIRGRPVCRIGRILPKIVWIGLCGNFVSAVTNMDFLVVVPNGPRE